MKTEKLILKSLFNNEDYSRKVLPYLKEQYFNLESDKALFQVIRDFIITYGTSPTHQALLVEIESKKGLSEDAHKEVVSSIKEFEKDKESQNEDWLLDTTEKFCQQQAMWDALSQSIDIAKTNKGLGTITKLLTDAMAVSFDPHVGHEYLMQFEHRFDYYHKVEFKIPFDLEFFNKVTNGGVSRKTLNVIMAGTGVGKSLFMCHMAASCLTQGKNVLYITLELSEDEVAKRIDSNLMDVPMSDIKQLPKDVYLKKGQNLKAKTNGKLFIKEYPTASASAIHFRALLNELNLKKSFKPDIIFIDYINICASSRVKNSGDLYGYVKSIAEELRGLAVEFDVPIVSATQTNRSGYGSSDVGLTNTSESFGLPMTVDFQFAAVRTEELDKLNQIMIIQLKSRYDDIAKNRRFVIGVDITKMKLYDVEQSAQKDIIDSGQTKDDDKFKKLKV